jgi:hypothetical protein
MRVVFLFCSFGLLIHAVFANSAAAQTPVIGVDFGGDYNGPDSTANSNSPIITTGNNFTSETGDFNGDSVSDTRSFIPFGYPGLFIGLDAAFPAVGGLPGKNNRIYAAVQLAGYSSSQTPSRNLFRYNTTGNSLQFTNAAFPDAVTPSEMGMAFAPHVRKADFLNGLDAVANVSFADQEGGLQMDWRFAATGSAAQRARFIVQNGSEWYISASFATDNTPVEPIAINPFSENWYAYDPSANLFYQEVGGGDTTPIGIPVLGSSLSDIQALGVLLTNTSFVGSANAGNFSVLAFSGVLIESEPTGGLVGDYNGDGTVDAADYTVWRDNLGGDASAAFAVGSRDTSLNGPIDNNDYDTWRANFGNSSGGAMFSTTAVPEPTALAIATAGFLAAFACSRRPQ